MFANIVRSSTYSFTDMFGLKLVRFVRSSVADIVVC